MKPKSLFAVVAVIFCGTAGSIACSSSSPSTTGSEQDSKTKKPGSLGGMCGGIAGIRCDSGLECSMPKGASPDASGTCVEQADSASGDLCFNPHDCDQGFSCKDGRCVADTSGEGDLCYTDHDCDQGFSCKNGRCVADTSSEGDLCYTDHDCDQGLTCRNGRCAK